MPSITVRSPTLSPSSRGGVWLLSDGPRAPLGKRRPWWGRGDRGENGRAIFPTGVAQTPQHSQPRKHAILLVPAARSVETRIRF